MNKRIFVCNCGSSSVKVDVFEFASDDLTLVGQAAVERVGKEEAKLSWEIPGNASGESGVGPVDHAGALRAIADIFKERSVFDQGNGFAVGHRVVHGGARFTKPVLIDDAVEDGIKACIELAPLHNPANLNGIRACKELFGLPQVAVFDTAFHATLPPAAYLYAIPHEIAERHGLRRYGFHGTSHEYVAKLAAKELQRPLDELKIITAHLGNGASVCAINGGRSVETSMGFTPLEGLIMGTRSGDLDPALALLIAEKENLNTDETDELLNRKSGMLGLCGVGDMRDVLERATRADNNEKANEDDRRALVARDAFCHRLRKYIGAYLAVLGGANAIVFTAGIGENSAEIRARTLQGLTGLGIDLDAQANESSARVISGPNSKITVLVLPTDEERMIANKTIEVVG